MFTTSSIHQLQCGLDERQLEGSELYRGSSVLMSEKMNLLPIDRQWENIEIETVNLAPLTNSLTATIFFFPFLSFSSFALSCKIDRYSRIDVF